jgi:hypothetical protein
MLVDYFADTLTKTEISTLHKDITLADSNNTFFVEELNLY